ncbi:hypothetical protein [Sphingomonas hankookensis]|uniref:hypothetical protein n=1 Tax=Sphingomonas hankookensis TaxID=563996 RepID=UPI00234E53D9|nr:hypothetical protein [Sphingomonas hankookensis]WCP71541.1 hypothetical protein PPZ50_14450 [Sphingomonas hankookensis]
MTVAPNAPVPFVLIQAGGPIVASDTEVYRPPWQPDTQLGGKLVAWWSSRVASSIDRNGAGAVDRWRSLVGGHVAEYFPYFDGPKPVYEAEGWEYRDAGGAIVGRGPAIRFPAPTAPLAGSMLIAANFPKRDGKSTWVYLAAERHAGALTGRPVSVRPMITLEPPLLASNKRPQIMIGGVVEEFDPALTMWTAGAHSGGPHQYNARVTGVGTGRQFVSSTGLTTDGVVHLSIDGGATASASYALDTDSTPDTFTIGGLPNANNGAQPGRIAEILVVTDPTEAEHAALVGYCAWSTLRPYGLPADHRYALDGPRMP